jgi:hypothetical protein
MANHWNGYPVIEDDDHNELERRAATHAAHLSPQDAIATAYKHYKRDRHQKAAAHHLQAASTMARAGRPEDSDRHRLMYGLHLRTLGYGSQHGAVPVEVRGHLAAYREPEHIRLYTPHGADAWIAKK